MNTTEIKQTIQIQGYIEQGNRLREERQFEQALSLYQEAIKIHHNSCDLYHHLGETLAAKNELDAAIDAYKKSIAINPEFFWSHHCLGQTLFWQGKLDEAIISARQALKIEPDRAVFHFQLGLYLEHKYELDSAIAAYSQALKLEPDYVEAHQSLEAVLARKSKLPEDLSQRELAKNIEIGNIDLSSLISQGKYLIEKGDIENAITIFQQGIELFTDSHECYHFLGEALVKKHELEKAEHYYRQSISLNPEHHWSYHNLGQVLLWQDKLDEAISATLKAIKLKPDKSEFHEQLKIAIAKKSTPKISNISSSQLPNKSQISSDQKFQNIHLINQAVDNINVQDIVDQRKEAEREVNTYRKAIELDNNPDFIRKNNLYGKLADKLQKLGQSFLDEAVYYYNLEINSKNDNINYHCKSLKLKPDQQTLYCSLANILQKQGKKGADIFYQVAIQLEPKNPNAYIGLADLYFRNQRREEGVELLIRANRLNPDLVESYLCQLFVKI